LEKIGEESVIELRGGLKIQATAKGRKKGERVVLAIRPEAISIEKGIKKSGNWLLGTVEKITFEGNIVRYDVRLGNQDSIVVIQPSLTDEWFATEEKVTVTFEPEKTHVFAYPEAGLKEETTVE
jgi:ABC-type Fe3+/spermidine/putrescine transport system ATPase subunit